jgi:malate dehydrogenase (oxaloacetate-decarboxylating)
MDVYQESLKLHKEKQGKIFLGVKTPITSREDLSLAYTPGVAEPCREIAKDVEKVWDYTSRRNWVAVVSDGTAVLGLGDIGPEAGLPVMEGKAVLFKEFGGVDAFPICLRTKNPDEIVKIVQALEPSFGGINLEDISAPRCFEIEERLKATMGIPVFHDDQHGTAIVVLAGLTNALKIVGKKFEDIKIVVAGAGAAGIACTKIILSRGAKNVILIDSKGIISKERTDLNDSKKKILEVTNPENVSGGLAEAMAGADVFIGVSAPGIATEEMVKSMNKDAIVFAMSNPTPEIMPDLAKAAGARVVATGRSDYPNQINNVLAFPGMFRGTLDAKAKQITEAMKLAAAEALANYVTDPSEEKIIPNPLDKNVAKIVAEAVKKAI